MDRIMFEKLDLWQDKRDPPRERDQRLSALTEAWLATLQANVRPHDLCAAYPRVANRIAICWSDWKLTDSVLDEFLTDKRGGRKGFPARVREDLIQLRLLSSKRAQPGQLQAWRSTRTRDTRDDKWSLHLQSPSDRVGRR